MFGLATGTELRLAFYGVLLASIGAWVLYHDHQEIAKGRAEAVAQMKASSDALLAKAQKDIAAQTAQHAADVAANQVKLDASLKTNAVLSDALDKRVRDFAAYRNSHPDLPRPSGGPAAANEGSGVPPALGDSAVRLAERGNDLYRSNGELAASLRACEKDRDSLNGLPRP